MTLESKKSTVDDLPIFDANIPVEVVFPMVSMFTVESITEKLVPEIPQAQSTGFSALPDFTFTVAPLSILMVGPTFSLVSRAWIPWVLLPDPEPLPVASAFTVVPSIVT